MLRHTSHSRPPSSLLLLTLALLVLLAPPTSAGVMAALAALVFATAAGFAIGQGETPLRLAVPARSPVLATDAVVAQMGPRFEAVGTLRLGNAVQRLRVPTRVA